MKNLTSRILICVIVLGLITASITILAPVLSNPENHAATIMQLDHEISNVSKLSVGSIGSSAVISLLPDDSCTPIAEELAEFSTYFLLILSALYLEKYLVTLLGGVSAAIVIPLAGVIFLIGYFKNKRKVVVNSVKILVCAIVMCLIIPAGTLVSRMIYATYDNSIESAIEESERITVSSSETDEDANLVEKFTKWISDAALTVSEYVTGLVSKFVEALAVMIVTSCVIPILTILFAVWLVKIIFGVNISIDKPVRFARMKVGKVTHAAVTKHNAVKAIEAKNDEKNTAQN